MAAYVSTGVTVTFSTLSGELLDYTASGEVAETVDVSHQASSDTYREFTTGFCDGGEHTWTIHAGGTIPAVGTSGTLAVTLPSGAGTLSATALLTKVKGLNAPLGDKIVEELTFKVTGKPTWS